METEFHTMKNLFQQLGVVDTPDGIERFISQHKPIAPEVALVDASFWNASQKAFLQEAIESDSDWAEVVDHLDAMLR